MPHVSIERLNLYNPSITPNMPYQDTLIWHIWCYPRIIEIQSTLNQVDTFHMFIDYKPEYVTPCRQRNEPVWNFANEAVLEQQGNLQK